MKNVDVLFSSKASNLDIVQKRPPMRIYATYISQHSSWQRNAIFSKFYHKSQKAKLNAILRF